MKVAIKYLIPGCILSEDIYKETNKPIMKKKTVLTKEHINILNIFLVQNVKVEAKLVDGNIFKPDEVMHEEKDDQPQTSFKDTKFMDQFLTAVQQFKKLFTHWQGGTKVNAFEVRKIFLPLYELTPTKEELIDLHHYGTKNDYIYFHSVAVSVLSTHIGKKMNLPNGEIIQLGIAGLLSDAGMSRLPFNVFEKKGPLTLPEYEEVKKHPLLAYKLLQSVPGFTKGALLGILQHHEREDGSGYPMKLKGEKVHLFAKIIAICDIYHAMTSERNYRTKQSPYLVLEALHKEHFGKVDHMILNHFTKMMLDLSIGKKVRLNNGDMGEIIFIDNIEPTRPIIQRKDGQLIKLVNSPDSFIQEIIHDDDME